MANKLMHGGLEFNFGEGGMIDEGLQWARSKLAVIDVVTTGMDPKQNRICSLTMVLIDDGHIHSPRGFHVEQRQYSSAFQYTGIPFDDQQFLTFPQVLSHILPVLHDRIPVAYDARRARRFITAEFRRVFAGLSKYDLDLIAAASPPTFHESAVWIDPFVWTRKLVRDQWQPSPIAECKRQHIYMEPGHVSTTAVIAAARVLMSLQDRMPVTYGQLVREQGQLTVRFEAMIAAQHSQMRHRE